MNLEEIKELRQSFVDETSDSEILEAFDWLIAEVDLSGERECLLVMQTVRGCAL